MPDPGRFPDGLPAVIAYVHDKGLKFGLYTAAGNVTCGGNPGSCMHEVVDANQYAAWGIDYVRPVLCLLLGLVLRCGL